MSETKHFPRQILGREFFKVQKIDSKVIQKLDEGHTRVYCVTSLLRTPLVLIKGDRNRVVAAIKRFLEMTIVDNNLFLQ